MQLLRFPVLPGSAEEKVISCGLVKCLFDCLSVTRLPKNIKIRSHVSKLQQAKSGTFFMRHSVFLAIIVRNTTSGHTTSTSIFIRSSPTDDLEDWNCPSVHTSTKSFFLRFPSNFVYGQTSTTYAHQCDLNRSKVKVKVTDLPKLRKVDYARSISTSFSRGAQN